MINTKVATAVRLAIAFTAAASVALTTPMVSAEQINSIDVDKANSEKPERIAVTGSRIARSELSQPTPILTLEADDIARFGTPDLGSILAELPAIGATNSLVGNNNNNDVAGLSSADLRRLGAKRTLVLVNGKRHVAGAPGSAQVDLSTIPSALIERIEIITGGASAIYGSDAVTGVINVILKKNFEGIELSTTGSQSLEGVGANNHTVNLVAGTDISGGRGNITFFAGSERIKGVMFNDLKQMNDWSSVINPANGGEDDGIADKFRVPYVGSEMINAMGVLSPFDDNRVTFDKDGNRMDTCERLATNSFGFGSFDPSCDSVFLVEDYQSLLPDLRRTTVGSTLNYDINDNIRFYSDFKFTKADIIQQYQPGFQFGDININIADNAYLNDDVRAEFGGTGDVSMAKFFDELGNRYADNRRELFRIVSGVNGMFSLDQTDVDYELFYVYGETSNIRLTHNGIIPGNIAAAIDSVIDPDTGEAVCRSQLPSAQGEGYVDPATVDASNCVAYNPFGFAQASEAAMDWISADTTRQDTITQEVFGGSIASDLAQWFELPGGAVGFSAGFEYRKEQYETITDELTQSGAIYGAATPNEYGEYDVSEVFAEVSLPILANMQWAHELTIDAAFRYADYSHAGSTDAWKIGLIYAPIEDLRLRATHGIAVRAPNLSEAFSPLSPSFARISDPCDADNVGEDADRAANCAALGIPVGFQANDNVSIDKLAGGNPNLFSEESTSTTFGIVWTPEFIKNFSVTMDYYKVEIEDAIISVGVQDIADNCVDATGSPDTVYCSAIDRDPTTHDIDLVRSGFLNASALNISGVETEFRYKHGLDLWGSKGTLHFNVFASKLLDFERFEFQDRPDEIDVEIGEPGDPQWQLRSSITYALDDISVNWTLRYIDRVVTYDVSPNGGSPEDLTPGWIPSVTTHDLSLSYHLADNLKFNAGVRNVFDKLTPGYTSDGIYDLVGRRAFVGMTISFE